MNIILFIILLFGIYIFITQHKTKDQVIIKARLNKAVIVLVVFFIIPISMLSYACIEEFHNTKYFREEYSVGFHEVINDKEIEVMVNSIEGDYKELGEWALKTIRGCKELLAYVLMMICIYCIIIQVGKVRFEREGIRVLNNFNQWEEYKSYLWRENEISFLQIKDNRVVKFRVNNNGKDILDTYLKENTNVKENRS